MHLDEVTDVTPLDNDIIHMIPLFEKCIDPIIYACEMPWISCLNSDLLVCPRVNAVIHDKLQGFTAIQIMIGPVDAPGRIGMNTAMEDIVPCIFDRRSIFNQSGNNLIIVVKGRFRPDLFCVESSEFGTFKVNNEVSDFMQTNGYTKCASTYVNSIFVDNRLLSL